MFKPRIWLLGAPAAGKTTVRHWILNWMEVRGRVVAPLGIEEAQRMLMPEGSEDESYRYDARGALIILDPARRIPEALNLLVQDCQKATRRGGFVAELTHRDMMHALRCVPPGLLSGALVFHLQAPAEFRFARNLTRGSLQIPHDVVASYPELMSPEERLFLHERGATIRTLTTTGSLEGLRQQVHESMAEFFGVLPASQPVS